MTVHFSTQGLAAGSRAGKAIFLPAPAASGRKPVVVCMGDPGHWKEEYLFKVARCARERGMALLAVDLLGSGTGAEFDEIVGRRDLASSIAHLMDYPTTRHDVDKHRIALLGDGAGSSFAARGLALDNRFAAAVCDARFGICTSRPS